MARRAVTYWEHERAHWKIKRLLLAARVTHCIHQQEWNVAEFAAEAGLSYYTVYRMMRAEGAALPWASTLVRVARTLKVRVDWLLDLNEVMNTPKPRAKVKPVAV